MIICPLFLGAELYYNDMHLAFFEEATAPMRNVIEINHCREVRRVLFLIHRSRDAPADERFCFFFLHFLCFLCIYFMVFMQKSHRSLPRPSVMLLSQISFGCSPV